jgi:hypothetical protein
MWYDVDWIAVVLYVWVAVLVVLAVYLGITAARR